MRRKTIGILLVLVAAGLMLTACGGTKDPEPKEIFEAIDPGDDYGTMSTKASVAADFTVEFSGYDDTNATLLEQLKADTGVDVLSPMDFSTKIESTVKRMAKDYSTYEKTTLDIDELKSINPLISSIIALKGPVLESETESEVYCDTRNKIEYSSVNGVWYSRTYTEAKQATNTEILTATRRLLERITDASISEKQGSRYVITSEFTVTEEALAGLTDSEKTVLNRLISAIGCDVDELSEKYGAYLENISFSIPVSMTLTVENVGTSKTALYRITDYSLEIIGDVSIELSEERTAEILKACGYGDYGITTATTLAVSLTVKSSGDVVYTKPSFDIPARVKNGAIELDQ